MPTIYKLGEYDLAGYCLGVLEYGSELPRFNDYHKGDVIIALPANGLHCAGLEIVYEILQKLNITMDSKINILGNRTLGKV